MNPNTTVEAVFYLGDDNKPRFLGIFESRDRMKAARLSLLCQAMGWDNRRLCYYPANLNEVIDNFQVVAAYP